MECWVSANVLETWCHIEYAFSIFPLNFWGPKSANRNERNLISFILHPSVCSSCLITFILVPTAATCPKVRNLVLCRLWLQPHHKYFPDQKPENEAGCFFHFQHSSATYLEKVTYRYTNHLFSSYIYHAIFMLKGFGGKRTSLLNY